MLPAHLAEDRIFWERYEWRLQDEFSYPELELDPIELRLNEHDVLLLDTGEDFGYISLLFQSGETEEVEVAWDDEAHFHPFLLRVDEWLQIITRLASVHDAETWIPGLLLLRFVWAADHDQWKALHEHAKQLRLASGLYTEVELEKWPVQPWQNIARQWRYTDAYGWILEGEDAYSLRCEDNTAFPFKRWNQMLAGLAK